MLEELWIAVEQIPKGKVMSYGELGRSLNRPVSGVLVGKWMTQCPPHQPWWRVVGKNGDLLVAKRDPRLAAEQQQILESEGVVFLDGRVSPKMFFGNQAQE